MSSHLIVGGHLSQAPNDKNELEPTLDTLEHLPAELGSAKRVTADNGYFSKENIKEAEERQITPYLATGCRNHNQHWSERLADPDPPPEEATGLEAMQRRLKTLAG